MLNNNENNNSNENNSNVEEYVNIYDLMPGNANNKPKNTLGRMASLHFPTKRNFQTPTKKRARNVSAPKKAAEQNGYSTPKRQMIDNNTFKNLPNAPKKHKSRKTRRIIRRK